MSNCNNCNDWNNRNNWNNRNSWNSWNRRNSCGCGLGWATTPTVVFTTNENTCCVCGGTAWTSHRCGCLCE